MSKQEWAVKFGKEGVTPRSVEWTFEVLRQDAVRFVAQYPECGMTPNELLQQHTIAKGQHK